MDHELLVLTPFEDEYIARIRAVFPTLHHAPWADVETIRKYGRTARGVWTNGTVGMSAAAMDAMPSLGIVHAHGAGHDQVDVPAAAARGIVVTNGAGTNDSCVADHAMALLLAAVRDIPRRDAEARKGAWTEARTNRPVIYGRRLGIVGLGKIGRKIARRAAGFDMTIGYYGRTRQDDVPYTFYPDIVRLAAESDFLVLSCVGGQSTRHIVNAAVLEALGKDGFLVNVARASVVETDALIAALREGRIAGAAVDVFDNEPGIPEKMRDAPNLVLSPHAAGVSDQVRDEQIAVAVANFQNFFAGRPVQNVISAPAPAA